MAAHKDVVFLWFDQDAEAAARLYDRTFPDSEVRAVMRAPSDTPSVNAEGKMGLPPFLPDH